MNCTRIKVLGFFLILAVVLSACAPLMRPADQTSSDAGRSDISSVSSRTKNTAADSTLLEESVTGLPENMTEVTATDLDTTAELFEDW
jgi:hypothetical protein